MISKGALTGGLVFTIILFCIIIIGQIAIEGQIKGEKLLSIFLKIMIVTGISGLGIWLLALAV